jgi:NAD(P)-dependent dehydrogenase (short-subunit alcohol dehydrogenase family)
MNQAALVTGGARRIGREIVLALADQGYHIALHYGSSQKEAEKVAELVCQKGVQCHLFQCDLNDMDAVTQLVPRVFDCYPGCNLLINNASIFHRSHMMETDSDLFDRHFMVNLKAPFFLSQSFARNCKKGHIINMLDTKISRNLPAYFVYNLSKKTLFEFTKLAARDLGPDIRVNGISPGLILPSSEMSRQEFEELGNRIPLQMTGNPEEIITALYFLMENNFITGETIFVDGGEHLK